LSKEIEMALKLKFRTIFPALVSVISPILLTKAGASYTFGLDINALLASLPFQPVATNVDQQITAGATATVGNDSATVRVNKASGSATTLTLPPAASKVGSAGQLVPVLIADWKGDAGTNNITINPNGSETIQGRSSWTIAADNGSIFLRPIPGVGYAI
jgi:hypothetical protein